MPFNFLKSELRYCIFSECQHDEWSYVANLYQKLIAMATFLRDRKVIYNVTKPCHLPTNSEQESLAVASIARDDPSTLPGDDPFPRACMHRDRNAL